MVQDKELVIKAIGNRVRALRYEKFLTLESLSFKADMDYKQLSRIELGKINTSIYQIYKIANALQINASEIINALDQK
jgi:hypothetical protein